MLTRSQMARMALAALICATLGCRAPRVSVVPPVLDIDVVVNVDAGTITVSPPNGDICWDANSDPGDDSDGGECADLAHNTSGYPWQVNWNVSYRSSNGHCAAAAECSVLIVLKKPTWVNGTIYPKTSAILATGTNLQGKPRPPVNTVKLTKRSFRYGLQAQCFSAEPWCRSLGGIIASVDPDIMPHGP